MLCASPKMMIPVQTSGGTSDSAGKRGSVKDGFSEILDRIMNTVRSISTFERRQSVRGINNTVSSANVSEPRLKTQAGAERSDSPTEETFIPSDLESVSGTENGEQNRGKADGIGQMREVPDSEPEHEILLKRIKIVQGLLGDISALLQLFRQIITEPGGTGENTEGVNLEELKQQILLKLNEAAELIRTSDIPELEQAFADKLLQIFENGLPESANAGEEQVPIEFINDLEGLVQKMLFETEAVKSRLAGEIPSELAAGRTEAPDNAGDIINEQPEQAEPQNTAGSKLQTEQVSDAVNEDGPDDAGLRQEQEQSPADIQKVFAAAEDNAGHNFAADTVSVQAKIPNAEHTVSQTADRPPVTGLRQTEGLEYQIIRQVIEKAETLFGENRTEMVIVLKPESLGKLTLRVIHERDGITAGFIAENEQVKAVIESNLRFLEDSLRRSGIELQNLAVSVGQNGHSGQNGDDRQYYSERTAGRKTPVLSTAPVNDMHHIYRFEGASEGLIQIERPAIDLTA
ncbi:MAG: flagellar hook-length control protein FliK [Clostridiaceae bacterium]|nr:flagellar hook-length control protein FliK [Clostridiaceae bacterium]